MVISRENSWNGWKPSQNFKSALKNMLMVMVPAVLVELVTHNMVTAGVAGLIGPMILKAIEYYITEY